MPAKQITMPAMRDSAGLSFSQTQATRAPNMGTVAFNMDDKPVVIDSSANARQANGMAELNMPMTKIFFQCCCSSGSKPLTRTIGSKNAAAIATRPAAVAMAPNSSALKRMNKKEDPHSAPSAR